MSDAPEPAPATPADDSSETWESPAFPRLVRILTVVLVVDLLAFGLWLLPEFMAADWSTSGLLVFVLAAIAIVWMGGWIVHSKTRLDGDALTQTWLWTKRVRADEVASMKLVHLRALERIMAPRLLVRRRGGGVTWFHSADAELLVEFAQRVAKVIAR